MMDTFKTIESSVSATYTEKRSKFIAFAIPVNNVDEIKVEVEKYRKQYYDARHVCWAYMLGADRCNFRANDDGEPSGTAGKPILGQINSKELTNILIIVVRYFGGIKLGTGGLIVAYREAAALAISEAIIAERTVDCQIDIEFGYITMNDVMKIIKEMEPTIIKQEFDMVCSMTLEIRKAEFEILKSRLQKVEGINIIIEDET